MQHRQRLFVRGAVFECRGQQPPGLLDVAGIEGLQALIDEGLGLALPFGLGAPRPVDVGAGTVVGAVEEQDAGPDVDGVVEAAGEVFIEPRHEQLLDARRALDVRQAVGRPVGPWRRLRHACKSRGV